MSANEIVWFRHIFEQYSQLKRFICAVDSKLSLCGSLSLGGTGFCLVLGGEVRAHVVYFAQKRQLAHIHTYIRTLKNELIASGVQFEKVIAFGPQSGALFRSAGRNSKSSAHTEHFFTYIKAFPFFRQARTMRRILHLPK